MKSRTRARGIALQALYEYDLSGHSPALSIEQRLQEEPLEEKLKIFSQEIVLGVFPLITKLDELIATNAPDWPLDQVASIDRNIIRIALWEFAVEKCTPVKVAINEAIELAKVFGSDSTPRFVNGVLGSLAGRIAEIQTTIGNFQREKNNLQSAS
jgi:transcription antitermination protein NusB